MSDTRTDPQYKLRLTPKVKELIEKHAKEAGRSLNQEIMFRVMQAYAYEPAFEDGKLEKKLARETINELKHAVASASRQLNVMMLHIANGDHPDTWGIEGLHTGDELEELFEAFRSYSEELGLTITLPEVIYMCGRKWLEHIGRMPATEGLSEHLWNGKPRKPRKSPTPEWKTKGKKAEE